MENVMLQLLDMSIQAAIAVGIVLIVRLLFMRLGVSKKYASLLWLIPYLSMICPWKLKSSFGLWESRPGEYQTEPVRQAAISIQNGVAPFADVVSPATPAASIPSTEGGVIYGADGFSQMLESTAPADIPQIFWTMCGCIWIAGIVAILVYSVISYIRLRNRLLCSIQVEERIYLADDIDVPFVFGLFHPQIYLPSGMEREYLQYVTEHERTHIRRRDPVKKMAAFLITCIHWFNPFAWLAFSFFGRDMEMACDEETIEKIGIGRRKDYANALLTLSTGRSGLMSAPLAFGEGNSGNRIKNILRYKRNLWITAAVAILVVAALALCFFTRRESTGENHQEGPSFVLAGEDGNQTSAVEGEQNVSVPGMQPNGEEGNTENSIVGENQTAPIESAGEKIIEITPPHINGETIFGIEGPILDYADEELLIFHDYYGLFVYNIEAQRMTDALDLEVIGCQYTQGDNYCEVWVEEDVSRIYLHPLSEEDMYVYDVEEHTLTMRKYSLDNVSTFKRMKQIMDCINPDTTVFRSWQCATLTNNTADNRYRYLYLESASGMAMDLCYVIGTTSEELERGRLFAEYDIYVNNDILENTDISESIDIREDIINADEIDALGGIIEVAREMTYGEFMELHWTTDVDNSLAEDERLYVVRIYYPDGFDHYKVGRIEHCETIGLYRADTGEYLGGSFAERQKKL